MSWLIYNGNLQESEQALFTADNRAFCYGDALFETIRVSQNTLLNIQLHLQRLHTGMKTLHLETEITLTPEVLTALTDKLMEKNGISNNARLRLQVFRNAGGYYTPVFSKASFLITVEPLEKNSYEMNEKGLLVDVFEDARVHYDKLSALKTTNCLPYILAGLSRKETGLDDYLMMNTEGGIAEATSSNVFTFKDNTVYTPGLDQGCVDGVMRLKIIDFLKKKNMKVMEVKLLPRHLLEADEVFLSNSIAGIRWVLGFQQKRYFNHFSKKILTGLNEEIRSAG